MKKSVLTAVGSLFAALPVLAALQPGTSAPMFEARASLAGQEFDFSLREALAEGPVVVYFYPSAYTQGCNIQAREFSENMEAFEAAGATVVGVSLDSIERLNDFSADPEYCAGKLAVASDATGDIARSFNINVMQGPAGMTDSRGEVIGHDFAERITFVVLPDGTIADTIGETVGDVRVSPLENVQQSLAAVQELAE